MKPKSNDMEHKFTALARNFHQVYAKNSAIRIQVNTRRLTLRLTTNFVLLHNRY